GGVKRATLRGGRIEDEHHYAHRLAAQLRESLLTGAEPDDTPAVLLFEVLLDEAPDRVVVLHEEEGATGCPCGHALRIGAASAQRTARGRAHGPSERARRRPTVPRRSPATSRGRATAARASSAAGCDRSRRRASRRRAE